MQAEQQTGRVSSLSGARIGLVVGGLLLLLSFGVPQVFGWDVRPRSDDLSAAPTHGFWDPKVGWATIPAVLLAVIAVWRAERWSMRWAWRPLLFATYVAALAWMLSLTLVDGEAGLTRAMANKIEYLHEARQIDDVGLMLRTYVDRIPFSHPDNWAVHLAGHPPGAVMMFLGLIAVGLGSDLASGIVITVIAASMPAAVMVTLRVLGAESWARLAAPFLVFTPAAIYMSVSADAVFTVTAAWGLACLAIAAVARRGPRMVGFAVAAGLLLGWCVMCSYGLPLLGVLCLAVLALARSWWPLPIAASVALAMVLAFAAAGFAWWEAYPVLHDRYWDGMARERPAAYWMWGNLGALLVSAGPALGAGLGHLARTARERTADRVDADTLNETGRRVVVWLATAAVIIIVIADLSRMSKAEVERIWLPFVPWLLLSLTLLPERWRRPMLALQVVSALLVQHLLYTTW